MHEEKEHALVSVQSGARYQLGQKVIVRLEEATPISGGLLFEMISPPMKAQAGWRKPRTAYRSVNSKAFAGGSANRATRATVRHSVLGCFPRGRAERSRHG